MPQRLAAGRAEPPYAAAPAALDAEVRRAVAARDAAAPHEVPQRLVAGRAEPPYAAAPAALDAELRHAVWPLAVLHVAFRHAVPLAAVRYAEDA